MSHAEPIAHSSDPAGERAKADVPPGGGRAHQQLDWMEVLETGIEALDAWHRQLIRQCNELLSAACSEVPWATIIEKSDVLAKSCVEHFRFEESLMDSNDFPRADAHREEHRRIAAKLWWLADAVRAADGTGTRDRALPLEFKAILLDVMVRHDLDYLSHLQDRLGR
jgi:hemerythrin-like metal-binding protein